MICKVFSMRRFGLLSSLVVLMTCSAFAQNRKVEFNEIFTLYSGETAEIDAAKLAIRLSGVGRTIAESGEVEYVELQISASGAKRKIVISENGNKTKIVGAYAINLVDAESFGKANCRLKVSRKK